MMNYLRKRYNLTITGLMIIIMIFSVSCKNKTEQVMSREDIQKKEGIPVEIVTVKKGDVRVTVESSGELKADDALTINTNNSGIIEELNVKEGDYVKKGQIVAVIEPNDIEDQLTQAQAALNTAHLRLAQAQTKVILQNTQVEGAIKQAEAGVKSAEAQYEQAQSALEATKEKLSIIEEGARKQEIAQAEEAVAQAEANFREAKVDLGRMQRLCAKGAISQQQMDVAQVQYDVAEAQYKSVLHRLDLVKEGSRMQEKAAARQDVAMAEDRVTAAKAGLDQAKESLLIARNNRMQVTVAQQEVDVAEAGVAQAQANLDTLSRKLQKSYVKSPISGYVTKKYVNLGENTSGPGATKIIDVFDQGTLYFEALVSETDIAKINRGLSVDIKVDGMPDKNFSGIVKDVIPQAGAARQFSVKIKVDASGSDLKPGMFARGQIILAEHKDVPVITKDAIKDKEGRQYVYTIKELYAVETEVTTGPAMDGSIEIVKGLSGGEKVVYSGFVKNGDLVKIIHEE
ncbi:MAG: efflux RND transporter periplasmic adaptor subunit [Candidatus Eremiobacterota bacterium]